MRHKYLILSLCLLTLNIPVLGAKAPDIGFNIERHHFGYLKNGESVFQYTLVGPNMTVSVINYGGIITALEVPAKSGTMVDVVLGYDDFEDYQDRNRYFGAIVGRFANRIEKGKLSIAGEEFKLEKNRAPHHLHGGNKGLDKVVWQSSNTTTSDTASLTLNYLSPDGEAGYPGNLEIEVTYTINRDNALIVEYRANTDRATVFNPTNHSYFNLSGHHHIPVYDHYLQVNANAYLPLNDESLPLGFAREVSGTSKDYRQPQLLSKALEPLNSDLIPTKGLDHFFIAQPTRGPLVHMAALSHVDSGIKMDVLTTEVGAQIYSGNYLNPSIVGKKGTPYPQHAGICIETSQYPNSPNNDFPMSVVTPSSPYYSKTVYLFSALD